MYLRTEPTCCCPRYQFESTSTATFPFPLPSRRQFDMKSYVLILCLLASGFARPVSAQRSFLYINSRCILE